MEKMMQFPAPDSTFEWHYYHVGTGIDFHGHRIHSYALVLPSEKCNAIELKLVSCAVRPRSVALDAYDCMIQVPKHRGSAVVVSAATLADPWIAQLAEAGPRAALSISHYYPNSSGKERYRPRGSSWGVEISQMAPTEFRLKFCDGYDTIQLETLVVDVDLLLTPMIDPLDIPAKERRKNPRPRDFQIKNPECVLNPQII